ncbi:ATP-binding protein [Povalibacter sp.]|uniref:ATP-binding protein n=1 Tax=Povalibacter sp. TaxID=1962978 RepID=UPI002F3F480B
MSLSLPTETPVGVELAQARAEIEEQARAIAALNKVAITIASRLDIQSIVQSVTDAATELVRAQYGAFFYNVTDERGESFSLSALSGASREAFEKLPLPRSTALFSKTFRGEGIVRLDDVRQHALYGEEAPYFGMPAGHYLPVRSYLAVPVVARSGKVHGGLFFGHEVPGLFTERQASLLQAIAVQAGIAIDSAQLLESQQRAQEQLRYLNETLEEQVLERTRALQRSELQFHQLVAGVADCAIYMLDATGHIASWNPGAERIKGHSATEIIGRHFSEFYTPEDRAIGKPALALATAASQGKYEAEAWRLRKDGTRFWASVLIDAIRNDEGRIVGFAKITRDMTEKRAMQEQLHQSQKMEAIGQLTGGVAHDFNNLLTVILGNLESIGRRIPQDNDRLLRAVQHATEGAERAATLTQQLLAFARRQPLNPKPTDLNRLIARLDGLLRQTLRENIALDCVFSPDTCHVEIDAHQLESTLLNLAVNARDAMPQGGRITIETTTVRIDEHSKEFISALPGDYVQISVTDTGRGMSADVLARAFDPFFTTKPFGEGTGLGLSQVFGFVTQSGGHVRLQSEPGRGTTAKIYLPRVSGVIPVEDATKHEAPVRGRAGEAILVVEDDDDVRVYSTEALRELGFTVLEAQDGVSALRMLERHPEIRLLFTDVGLPGINGRELVEAARSRRADLPVLFTSGYERNALMHDGRLDPGVDLLSKPFTRAQLASRIRASLDASRE